MFTRIAVINRGEAARRLINAVREVNAELGGAQAGPPMQTVALFTDGERDATFVREADMTYGLGPAAARPYLDLAVLERALRDTGADAAWVGWGFVAEDPAFAELCDRLGITFIGPSAAAMRRLGDKIGAKLIAEEVGVPVAAWSGGALDTVEDALAAAERIGYPLMLKATAGGGGRGIRLVTSDDELRHAFTLTREEAARAFGSGVVFLERLVTGARHVEVQVIADQHGNAWALGVRDCSIQRRNQKVIEESASPMLSVEQTTMLRRSAERLANAVGYCGACTVEFLYHPGEQFFAFLEVNTRLQVEHPITEATTGFDLVKAQLRVAAGLPLAGPIPAECGHAIEARLNAEDPDRDFAPSPGRVDLLRLPAGPGIRVDTGVTEGDVIPADFDSMIAKIIAVGHDRAEAMARLRRAVADTTVIIDGGTTNKSFLLSLLDAPELIDASADTRWVDRVRELGRLTAEQHLGIALTAAAIDGYEQTERLEREHLWDTGRGGRPDARHDVGRPIALRLRERGYRIVVGKTGLSRYRVCIDDQGETTVFDADIQRIDAHFGRITVSGHTYRLVTATHGPLHLVEVDGVTHRVSRDETGVLRAPAPALVVAIPAAVGAELVSGAPVLVLESMKMETVVRAPFDARLRELMVSVGAQVASGAPIAVVEPLGEPQEQTAQVSPAVDLMIPEPVVDAAAPRACAIDGVRGTLLGFDPAEAITTGSSGDDILAAYLANREQAAAEGDRPLAAEVDLIKAFADISELMCPTPVTAAGHAITHSPREQWHIYLQSLDVERGGLSQAFRGMLTRTLGHYGVHELDRSTVLEEAVFRIVLAKQRYRSGIAIVTALLKVWLTEPAPPAELHARTRDTLDRLGRATQKAFPMVADLARSVVFRWFLQPEAEAAKAAVLEGVSNELHDLAQLPQSPARAARIAALVDLPEPLYEFLADRLGHSVYTACEPMLEVVARWHYGEQELQSVAAFDIGGRPFVVCDYRLELRPHEAVPTISVATLGGFDELAAAENLEPSAFVAALHDQLEAVAAEHVKVLDLYLYWPDAPDAADQRSAELCAALARAGLHRDARRIVVGVVAEDRNTLEYFTFRKSAEGLSEDTLLRGVHPLVGRRLYLWRLTHFHITRMDSPTEVLLFHCVAKDNKADQRLVALAQVPRFEVTRDESGRITAIDGAETVLNSCVEAIGRARHELDPAGRWLDMNHVWLDIRPVVDVDLNELVAWQRATAPRVALAGIEEVLVQGRILASDGSSRLAVTRFSYEPGASIAVTVGEPPSSPMAPLNDYDQKVLRARRRGTVYPYELVAMLAGTDGEFSELDLDATGSRLTRVDRAPGHNSAGIVVGVVSTPTPLHPEGIRRVVLFGDPIMSLGAVAEAECVRILAALDLAQYAGLPVEWFALSAGARISMDSGTENMDWVARVLRRIVQFTQEGGEINVVVAGINVGAQPYWNAEATMLMHTKGILVMTPDSAMVLTGKQSLDFSGGVSAEDNFGIGGYSRIMGPNGQAQYWADNLAAARELLLAHYAQTYVAAGETAPRRVVSFDPVDRDICAFPHAHPDSDFKTVGDIFSSTGNPDRKKAFDIRAVLRAVADQDHPVSERWAGMAEADTAVVTEARIGGWPATVIGIESRPVPRHGFPPADGPDTYTAGTLFPLSSKKVARAINAASGNRPVVVLANLSGFDGSPESMRRLQLEYGAEIGRAVVNFDGKIVFCVISRYHGGAFVVFSKALNPNMTVLAVEGSFASVIGGAPAAAVVFAREVDTRTNEDPRVKDLERRIVQADTAEKPKLRTELVDVRAATRAEHLGRLAADFDGVHSIERAVRVGSVDAVVPAAELRPRIATVVAEWMQQQ